MQTLESPARRYLTGKLPSHSELSKLHTHFKGVPAAVVPSALKAKGYLSEAGKPTKRALHEKVLDLCDGKAIWRIESIEKLLKEGGLSVQRIYGNQEIAEPESADPVWVNLTVLATYFNATPVTVGRWLDALELRDEDGLPTKDAQDRGLGNVSEMAAGKKKTRKIAMWESYRIRVMLRDAGHPLDFDYMKSLEAKGKNSAVAVDSLDARAEAFAREFAKQFRAGKLRETKAVVHKVPTPILTRAEKFLGREPGWLTSGAYLDRLV